MAAPADPLATPLTGARLPGGAALARLRRLGIVSVRDLLFHLPRRYDDLRAIRAFRSLVSDPPVEPVSGRGTVVELHVEPTIRRRVERTIATLRDDAGDHATAVWFGRRFIDRRLRVGDRVVLTGKVKVKGWSPEFQGPEFGPDTPGALHAGRIVPVYRLTAGVTNPWLRRAIRVALDEYGPRCVDYLPDGVRAEHGLVKLRRALEEAHYPSSFSARDAALLRLAFDELLALQIGMISRDRQRRHEDAQPVRVPAERYAAAIAVVEATITARVQARLASSDDPERRASADAFAAQLTGDQRSALDAIRADLERRRPMRRLLQGDVGSGKTAVAALALAFAADAGRQAVLLAPTDLLARQHAATLDDFLGPLGYRSTLLTGSLRAGERRHALEALAGEPVRGVDGLTEGLIAVGTHALLQEGVGYRDLGLAVIDEQHRFGVEQRDALAAKGRSAHVLLMTATPIPQTLGRIFHADLDVSDIRMQPSGRRPIATGIRRFDQLMHYAAAGASRGDARSGRGACPLIVREVSAGHRAFVVVPLVEEDETTEALAVDEAREGMERALPEAARLAGVSGPLPRVRTVHGQMRPADRDASMEAFRTGECDVLVGTTVVEVGVDVPEATVMLVLNADRFGVAQLHQLRGRVGRGEAQSYCILVSDVDEQTTAGARLRAVADSTDGFALAELDFTLREAGNLLGYEQSGLPPLRVASLTRPEDREISVRARALAERLVDGKGRLKPGKEALGAELATGWLARVGAGEALAGGGVDG